MKKIFIFLPIFLFALKIEKIEYKGLIHLSKESANSIITISPNEDLDIEKVDESIKKLYKTGYFKTIKADYQDGVLTFIFKEKPTISKIELINVSEDLKKLLKSQHLLPKKGEILDKEKLAQLKKFIKEYYTAKGFFETSILINQEIKDNFAKIEIIVNKGKKVVIKKVNFYGSTLKEKLLDEIENRPRDFWSIFPFTNSGYLNIYKLPEDREKIRDFYYNLGYLDAKVSLPLAKINLDSNFAYIDYKITEGKRYIVKDIQINYPKNIKIKLPKLKLQKEKYFNISALREDLKTLTHAFEDLGYAYAKVYPDIKKGKNSIKIIYQILPGEIVYIRNVIIKGNNKTLDRVIRRNVYLAPGYKYSYTDYIDSLNSLKRKGYLENVKIIKKRVSKNQMDIIINAQDGLSGILRAGVSYGSYTKFGFMLSVSDKNIFGSGQSLTLSTEINSASTSYKLSLFNPRVLDTKYSLNAALFNSKFEGVSYTSKENGGYIGIGKMLNRNLRANITYGYITTKLSDYETTEYIKPKSIKSYMLFSLDYDNTDDYFFPTDGIKASYSLEFAGLGGDEKFIKNIAKAKYFYPLIDKTYSTYAVLKAKATYGYIADNGYLPINEKFYLGGAKSIRGFSWYSISPEDNEGNLIGGDREFITNFEISTPLSIKSKMWLTGFIDYGAVGEKKLNITRSSYGFEIDWITPMGPISFIWGWPIKSEKDDDLQRFEFTLGATF